MITFLANVSSGVASLFCSGPRRLPRGAMCAGPRRGRRGLPTHLCFAGEAAGKADNVRFYKVHAVDSVDYVGSLIRFDTYAYKLEHL